MTLARKCTGQEQVRGILCGATKLASKMRRSSPEKGGSNPAVVSEERRHCLQKSSSQARISQYREGKAAGRGILPHGEERQCDARKLDMIVVWLWIPRECFILAGKSNHKLYNGRGQKRYFEDALAAPFDLSQDHWMAIGDQAAASG